MQTHDIGKQSCPGCGFKGSSVENTGGAKPPEPGDILTCTKCGTTAIFKNDMTIHAVREEDFTPELREIVEAAGKERRFKDFFSTFEK